MVELVNIIFAMPSIVNAALIYGLAWSLIFVPFMFGWVARQIRKSLAEINRRNADA